MNLKYTNRVLNKLFYPDSTEGEFGIHYTKASFLHRADVDCSAGCVWISSGRTSNPELQTRNPKLIASSVSWAKRKNIR